MACNSEIEVARAVANSIKLQLVLTYTICVLYKLRNCSLVGTTKRYRYCILHNSYDLKDFLLGQYLRHT